jgi:hypothetical protein
MTSSFKAQTDNTPQSSSGESTGAKARQSGRSASSDNTPRSMQTTKPSLPRILTVDNTAEKTRQHAEIAKVAILQLEKVGLIKRFKVLSADRTTVKEIRLVLDPQYWTPGLDLRVLSESEKS